MVEICLNVLMKLGFFKKKRKKKKEEKRKKEKKKIKMKEKKKTISGTFLFGLTLF